MRPSPRLFIALACATALAGSALAQTKRSDRERASAADLAAVEACLKLVERNGEKRTTSAAVENEKPGPEGRLAAAADLALADPKSCIGAVSVKCIDAPGGSTTAGMIDCLNRELLVWDERLNKAYAAALKDTPAKTATALRATQRAWLAWRDLSCKLPVLDNEGGSVVGPMTTECLLDATAHQALWLETRNR